MKLSLCLPLSQSNGMSPPARVVWIEIEDVRRIVCSPAWSPPARVVWIEITYPKQKTK